MATPPPVDLSPSAFASLAQAAYTEAWHGHEQRIAAFVGQHPGRVMASIQAYFHQGLRVAVIEAARAAAVHQGRVITARLSLVDLGGRAWASSPAATQQNLQAGDVAYLFRRVALDHGYYVDDEGVLALDVPLDETEDPGEGDPGETGTGSLPPVPPPPVSARQLVQAPVAVVTQQLDSGAYDAILDEIASAEAERPKGVRVMVAAAIQARRAASGSPAPGTPA